jgi:gluconolactonase
MVIPLSGARNLRPRNSSIDTADGRYVYDVATIDEAGSWTLENRRVFAHCDKGFPDGIKCDTLENVYSGCGDGVHVTPIKWKY